MMAEIHPMDRRVSRHGHDASRADRPEKGPFEIVERQIPEPGPGTVRIKVLACGICHSDSLVKEGAIPGIEYPRVPGHEVVGVIDAVGTGVAGWDQVIKWESVGKAVTAAIAITAGAVSSSRVCEARSPVSLMTEVTENTS
jgi:D-arabinose 1-dehydrogenase-like Zn-dependent alcohol dehydrogenase